MARVGAFVRAVWRDGPLALPGPCWVWASPWSGALWPWAVPLARVLGLLAGLWGFWVRPWGVGVRVRAARRWRLLPRPARRALWGLAGFSWACGVAAGGLLALSLGWGFLCAP